MKVLGALIVVAACLSYLAFRPVCRPIADEDLADFNVPIELRTDRDFYVKVFQFRDGSWHHCKTWISRKLFF
jgi:hypothetical protein